MTRHRHLLMMTVAATRHIARKSQCLRLLDKTQSAQRKDSQEKHHHNFHAYRALHELYRFVELILVQILTGNIVLGDLVGVHFLRVFIVCLLYTRDSTRLKDVSFLDQFIDAFRIRLLDPGQAL